MSYADVDPVAGDRFHVPGDTALVHEVRELLMASRDVDEWLVRATDGSHWILVEDDSLPAVRFLGRRARPRLHD